jgi:hypothetical protein
VEKYYEHEQKKYVNTQNGVTRVEIFTLKYRAVDGKIPVLFAVKYLSKTMALPEAFGIT